jgi:8-oxo-dGTP pyrophosphatase MutT (NUDIX family)
MFRYEDIKELEELFKERKPLNFQGLVDHVGSDMKVNNLSGGDDGYILRRHKGIREASVLIPIIEREGGYFIILTKRGNHLSDHPGQVSFPGGSREDGDLDDVETALRETWEEIGISSKFIDVIGSLEPYHTITGFRVTPIVGIVSPDFTLKVDVNEVAEVFEIPLIHILNKENHEKHSRELQGQTRRFFAMPYNDHYIWGATAAILVNLSYSLLNHIELDRKE